MPQRLFSRPRLRLVIVLIIAALAPRSSSFAGDDIRVLLLSGRNNHDWRSTTPALAECLEEGGRFRVTVLDDTAAMTRALLAEHDVVVSNFNSFVRRGAPEADAGWSKETLDALIDFVHDGKGHVTVHAGSSSFYDSIEYQRMTLGRFEVGRTDHGRRHELTVSIVDRTHPITRDLDDFRTFDELWHGTRIEEGVTVLAKAFSSKESGGSGKLEPVAVAGSYGCGRSVFIVLGHDAKAIESPGFRALLRRGTEWAATGSVGRESTPTAGSSVTAATRGDDAPKPSSTETESPAKADPALAFEVCDDLIALVDGERTIWRFRHGAAHGKPHFDVLSPASGPNLAWARPADHPWHYGLWFSWKLVNGVNYWEEDRTTGHGEGRTTVTKLELERRRDHSARIDMEVSYHLATDPPERFVLKERRTIEISAPNEKGAYLIDWQAVHESGSEPVRLDRTPLPHEPGGSVSGGYAGLSFRFRPMSDRAAATPDEGIDFDSTDRFRGRAVALDYSGRIDERVAGVAILDHPGNPGSPTPWYAIRSRAMTFFSPAVICFEPRTIGAGKSLTLRYRVLVHSGRLDPCELETAYEEFIAETRARGRERL